MSTPEQMVAGALRELGDGAKGWQNALTLLLYDSDKEAVKHRYFGIAQAAYLTRRHPEWWASVAAEVVAETYEEKRGPVIDAIVAASPVGGEQ